MNQAEFEKIFRDQVALCETTLVRKGSEYAKDADRLHNFKVAAALQGENASQALGGMLAKHIVSIYDVIQSGQPVSLEYWDEKIGDAMNYLFLLKAIIIEDQTTYLSKNNKG